MNCEQKSVELYLPVSYSNVGGKVETITKTRLHAHCLNPLHICLVGVRRYSGTNFCYAKAQAFDMNKPSADLYMATGLKPNDPIVEEDSDTDCAVCCSSISTAV